MPSSRIACKGILLTTRSSARWMRSPRYSRHQEQVLNESASRKAPLSLKNSQFSPITVQSKKTMPQYSRLWQTNKSTRIRIKDKISHQSAIEKLATSLSWSRNAIYPHLHLTFRTTIRAAKATMLQVKFILKKGDKRHHCLLIRIRSSLRLFRSLILGQQVRLWRAMSACRQRTCVC